MRLIDADAIPFRREIGDLSECPKMFVSKNTVDHLPTIDPESLRPKGEWVKDEEKDMKHCSGCGYRVYFTHNFCPSCGADMRGNPNDS